MPTAPVAAPGRGFAVIVNRWTLLCSSGALVALVATSGRTYATHADQSQTAGSASLRAHASAAALPSLDHIVIVVFENKKQASIIGNPNAPYFNELADAGANFERSYAITHPSQPNYVALFSGDTQGLTGDGCPHTFDADNEGHQLLDAGLTFASYAEGLPEVGSKVCKAGKYARKHAPWANFPNVPDEVQLPYTSFPADHSLLPDVSWVIPNLCSDMHDCSIAHGDTWLSTHLGDYASWAKDNNSLLIVTFDEDDRTAGNQIPTIFYGAHVVAGDYREKITHYAVLRTIEDMYALPRLGGAQTARTIKDIWN